MTPEQQELYDALIEQSGFDKYEAREIIDDYRYASYDDYAEFGKELWFQLGGRISLDMGQDYLVGLLEECIDWDKFGRAVPEHIAETVETDNYVFEILE